MNNIYGYIDPEDRRRLYATYYECMGASYFSDDDWNMVAKRKVPRTKMWGLFRFNVWQTSRAQCVWFLNKVVKPNLPNRVCERIQIYEYPDTQVPDIFQQVVDCSKFQDVPRKPNFMELYNQEGQYFLSWCSIELNVEDMSTEEMFAVFTFLRTPQDCPEIVKLTWELHVKFPEWTEFACYLVACLVSTDIEKPTLFFNPFFRGNKDDITNSIHQFDLNERWEKNYADVWSKLASHPFRPIKKLIQETFIVGPLDKAPSIRIAWETVWNQRLYYHKLILTGQTISRSCAALCSWFDLPTRPAESEEL